MKSRKYETPSMETITFADENIITASGEDFVIHGAEALPTLPQGDGLSTNILS